MKRTTVIPAGTVFTTCMIFGQTPTPTPSFEAASIRPNHSGSNAIGGGVCSRGGRVSVKNITLDLIIEQAYGIQDFQLLSRPSWLSSDRFDIEAKPESRVGFQDCNLMLRSLLADRSTLALHRETRQMRVYKLIVGKNGPKLQKVNTDAPLGIEQFNSVTGQLITKGISMSQLAEMLGAMGELEKLIVDDTGLDGYYKFKVEWSP